MTKFELPTPGKLYKANFNMMRYSLGSVFGLGTKHRFIADQLYLVTASRFSETRFDIVVSFLIGKQTFSIKFPALDIIGGALLPSASEPDPFYTMFKEHK